MDAQDEAARPRPSRRTLVLILVPIIGVIVAGTIGNAIHPTLVKEHPLWLVALEPRNRFLILVANKVDYLPFLVVATLRRLSSDPLFYLLGYLYGDAGVRWIERKMGEGGATVRAVERAFSKAAPVMVFLYPGAVVCVLAGATRMAPALFLALNVLGTVTVVTLMHRFASFVRTPVDAVNGFYGRNSRWLTAVTVALTLFWLWQQHRQGRAQIESVSAVERELTEGDREDPDEDTAPAQ